MRLHISAPQSQKSSLDAGISAFMLHQRASRHSECTITHYTYSLKYFKTFLLNTEIQSPQEIDSTLIREFLTELQTRFKPKTVHGVATDIKAFFNFLQNEGVIGTSPYVRVSMPRLPTTILPAFDKEEISKMIAATAGKDQLSIRNRAMILVLLDSGVRLTEMASIKVGDIDIQTGVFKVTGKGSKDRICHISPITQKALSAYSGENEQPIRLKASSVSGENEQVIQ